MRQNKDANKTHYNSIVMLHPDGDIMCRCSNKKAEWYIQRGLATRIDDSTFKLNFVPNGYGNREQPFYLEIKDNCCVVCGVKENLTKHHVVPYQFRSLFPTEYKSHDCHDVLLVCRKCHDKYEREADIFKSKILKDIGYSDREVNRVRKLNSLILSARTLLEQHALTPSIPESELPRLQDYAAMGFEQEPKNWKELFVEKYNSSESIHYFCVIWRAHFVEIMAPKYISEHFDVNHRKVI